MAGEGRSGPGRPAPLPRGGDPAARTQARPAPARRSRYLPAEMLDTLTGYLHEHFPLSGALGVAVESWDGRTLRLRAPLAPNLNHHRTAFGGSLSALAILCGWAALHLKHGEGAGRWRLVIQRSAVDFDAPVQADFTASATIPDGAEWARFLRTLERHGRARITVGGDLLSAGRATGHHEGVFVASPL